MHSERLYGQGNFPVMSRSTFWLKNKSLEGATSSQIRTTYVNGNELIPLFKVRERSLSLRVHRMEYSILIVFLNKNENAKVK